MTDRATNAPGSIDLEQIPTPSERAGIPTAQSNLGILFVHGIGEQREGETLLAFGEPLIAWIREWISARGRLSFREPMDDLQRTLLARRDGKPDGIEVVESALFTSRRHSTDPPHCALEIRNTPDDRSGRMQQRWIFTECWWGEQVQPPPVFELLAWLYSRAPFVAMMHFAERGWRFTHPRYDIDAVQGAAEHPGIRRRTVHVIRALDRLHWRHLVWLPCTIAWLLVALWAQIVLVVSTVIALIPLPFVRRYVTVFLQRTSSVLGDSYGLVANDTQRAAILTRFAGTVQWLEQRCRKVVIVAHSQGAAVVCEALVDRSIEPPALLMTFGAGLVKLVLLPGVQYRVILGVGAVLVDGRREQREMALAGVRAAVRTVGRRNR